MSALPESRPAAASARRVRELMPELKADLLRLARIRSIAFPGFPAGALREAYDAVADLLPGRRRGAPGDAVAARYGTDRHGRDPGARRRPDRSAVRPLRRPAARRRAALGHAAVRSDRARRRDLRARGRRRQGGRDRACRRPARLRRPAAGRHQGGHRGPGGARERARRLPARATRALPRRRDPDRRRGQRPAGRPDPDHRSAGGRRGRRRGEDAGRAQAQRRRRRRGPGRPDSAGARPRDTARRARERGGRRPAS